MAVRCKELGFTIVELLTAVVIIAMLIALLIPAIGMVRKTVKKTQQNAQFTTIDLALTAFKGDYGDYPPSEERDDKGAFYCGAQKLAEALMGQDLLGFHPDSLFRNDGTAADGRELYPDDLNPTPGSDDLKNLQSRRGPYLELATANAFRLGVGTTPPHEGLFDDTGDLDEDKFVICDVFSVKKISLADGRAVKAGSPILYYRANTSNKDMRGFPPNEQVYNSIDNMPVVVLGKLPRPDPTGDPHELARDPSRFYDEDYKLIDPKIDSIKWPYRPDSYILISAGADSEYGTVDDICNF
jgi:type II secretory pathway pseudopilin PulG